MLRGGEVLAELVGDSLVTHAQRLPAELARALDVAGLQVSDVELLAVTTGPGSFTGLRVGIATAQGLAMARGLRVVPVSTLEALAHASAGDAPIGAWVDAQRGEVFATLYEPDARTVRVAAVSARPERVLEAWRPATGERQVVFIGDGAVRYRESIAGALGSRARVEAAPPLAAIAGRIAAADPARAVLPHAVVPIYIRKPDVELARDRRSRQP